MEIISLSSLLEADESEGREVHSYLSSFNCEINHDVEIFLREKAIDSEKRGFTRTTLVIDEKQNNDIAGYFTLTVKNFDFTDVSGTNRKKLTGDKRATTFVTILIAQLGRSDLYKGKVSGSEILEFALERCSMVNELSAIKIACVEYKENDKLIEFYKNNDFRQIQKNESGYIISYVRL
ncbi:hypothetical protein [Sporosarcina sp. FSL K6-1508]|uniref:hypothetical protein n=1 Tax=Sporosarcina sp. FSL K6-1508 TaxID=2921553 RepID=UPI0030F8483D